MVLEVIELNWKVFSCHQLINTSYYLCFLVQYTKKKKVMVTCLIALINIIPGYYQKGKINNN